MDSKLAGGILLIVGTAIGAGMLALPIVTTESGYIMSSLALIGCWALMTFSAFLMLEVNLSMPPRNNLVTMARTTLGRFGEIVAWLSFLLLLYSLLAAYISGGSDLLDALLSSMGLYTNRWIDSILFVLIFGSIVFKGITPVDWVNRVLMVTKFGSLFLLIFFTVPYIHLDKLLDGKPWLVTSSITVMLTSFGFANIIPSLRSYFNDDVKQLRRAVMIGSLIPLFCYLIWDLAILGTLPHDGHPSLNQIMHDGGSVAELTALLSAFLNNTYIASIGHLFTTICVLTSFLCVSLSLSDFLADGLKIEKKGVGNWIVNVGAFLPPLLIVLFNPQIFVMALNYAGIFCVVIVILLPALMAYSGRYYKKTAIGHYQVWGGRLPIILVIVFSIIIISLGIKEAIG